MLAQVPELNDFVAGHRDRAAEHGVGTVEVPHLVRLIEELQFDTIYHEHYSYFSLTTLVRLFAAARARDLRRRGAPDRTAARSGSTSSAQDDDAHDAGPAVGKLLDRERGADTPSSTDVPRASRDRVNETKWSLLELLIGLSRDGKRVVGYGAPGKGNTLLNYCGIRSDLIEFTVDRNPHKQGKFLPGTHIPIYAPETIEETRPDYILILPWNLAA